MGLENVSLSSKRVFPPLYIATGDPSKDKLAFIHILERLKVRIILLYERLHRSHGYKLRLKSELDGLITR
jgi:hypothetical protein